MACVMVKFLCQVDWVMVYWLPGYLVKILFLGGVSVRVLAFESVD